MPRVDGPGPRYFVRLLGTKRSEFVEFAFSIGDPDLAVELVLPFEEFLEFCRKYDVDFLEPEPHAATAFEQLSWRRGEPELVRELAATPKTQRRQP